MTQVPQVLRVKYPCCYSVRSCNRRYHAIIDIYKKRVLKEVYAKRCYELGYQPEYEFIPRPNVILVDHYITTRGNIRLTILWRPASIIDDEAIRIAMEALGYVED